MLLMVFALETPRLILNELTKNDRADLHRILSDPITMQYYPAPYDWAGTEAWIDRSISSYYDHGYGLWAICLRSSRQFIGQGGILDVEIDGEILPEIGYHIHRDMWNQGLGTEAAQATLDYGFRTLKLPDLFIHTWIRNIPSRRVAEKLGMTRTKEFDKVMPRYDLTWRHVVYHKHHPQY